MFAMNEPLPLSTLIEISSFVASAMP